MGRVTTWLFAILPALLIALACTPARAVTHLKQGDAAPAIELSDIADQPVRTAELTDQTVVLIFGELFHDKTLSACQQLSEVLARPALRGQKVTPLLIVAQDAPADQLKAAAGAADLPRVLRDPQRKAFEGYRVAVLPSVVVIDGRGRVAHAFAALTPQFADVLESSVLLAGGVIDAEAFERRLHPPAPEEADSDQVRALRLSRLGDQLANRGLTEMAASKYAEALQLAPGQAQAHLGLGLIELNQRRLAEAQAHFRAALDAEPALADAALGLAFVHTLRGGDELATAQSLVKQVLDAKPDQPRAHYLTGLIHEKRGEFEQAAASFKKSAELLLETRQREAQP